jgi:hypothetical protein
MSVNVVCGDREFTRWCAKVLSALFQVTPDIAVAGEIERADEVTPPGRKPWRE